MASTFEQSDKRTIHTFHLYNLPMETESKCIFNKWAMYGAAGVKTNSPYGKMYKWVELGNISILLLQCSSYKLCKSASIVHTRYCGIFKIAAVLSIAHHSIEKQ